MLKQILYNIVPRGGDVKLFKLNFEKTAIFVLILIVAISTANIYSQFLSTTINRRQSNEVHPNLIQNLDFPARLLKADQLYRQGVYADAQSEYLKLTNMPDLSTQQKATVYFKLGVTNYRLNEYDLSIDSFLKSAEFNTGDPVAYNNAAVCAFYLNDLKRAEELQTKAIAILPVIEYHYNLARIYESAGRYEDSVKYYNAVVKAEENITREDRIDPVRVKNKVMKLMLNISDPEEISKELMIALKLKDQREVFIIEDADMDLKNKNFKWSIAKENGRSKLTSTYDRKASDPYNLIESIKWVLKNGEKTVYTSSEDTLSYSLADGRDYTLYLDINYGANKQVSSYANVMKGKVTTATAPVTSTAVNPKPVKTTTEEKCKYYEYAVYEQVFERNFGISESSYMDRFDVLWGKDDVVTKLLDDDFIDAKGSLYIKNTSIRRAGIWADLSSLLNDKRLKDKTIGIKVYAKKITDDAGLHINMKIKTGRSYKNTLKRFELNKKWQQLSAELYIPRNADGLTVSFKTDVDQELKIDGFIIYIVK